MYRKNPIYRTTTYDRKVGQLRKEDYLKIRQILNLYLEEQQSIDTTTNDEINDLKTLIWKVDHQAERM
ncbi:MULTISPECIES: hypothetical protein [Acinetobacter]|uniref:Uncharacterized protein n=1 Tax=Acinetobacter rudis TaxID=632955 RepID=A0AAW8J7S2_9GAMM|nr:MULTISPECIES: hypothetical protein [Acinetobacter]MDQ8935794.1 hypothetical protein [Acinetobacter rudis]MDQ9018005.1 hypothetical protein [Acinetobacter rudis]